MGLLGLFFYLSLFVTPLSPSTGAEDRYLDVFLQIATPTLKIQVLSITIFFTLLCIIIVCCDTKTSIKTVLFFKDSTFPLLETQTREVNVLIYMYKISLNHFISQFIVNEQVFLHTVFIFYSLIVCFFHQIIYPWQFVTLQSKSDIAFNEDSYIKVATCQVICFCYLSIVTDGHNQSTFLL